MDQNDREPAWEEPPGAGGSSHDGTSMTSSAPHALFTQYGGNTIGDADSGMSGPPESTSSAISSIYKFDTENRRTYHSYHRGKYPYPNDKCEQERMDLQHHMFFLVFGLAQCPIRRAPQRVLDVGTGTGIWAIDYAVEHPEAKVTGVDLSPIQPRWVPPNCQFEIDDIDDYWTWDPFDFIFIRLPDGNLQGLIEKAYGHLLPEGWLEIQGYDLRLHLFGESGLGDLDWLKTWQTAMDEATRQLGRPINVLEDCEQKMQQAGFVDVKVVERELPIGPWAKKMIHKVLGAAAEEVLKSGLEALSLGPLTRALGYEANEVHVLSARVREDLARRDRHVCLKIRAIYGRKP